MKSILCLVCIFVFCGVLRATPASSAQVQSSATLKWQDNSGNEQGFGIEMLAPTDANFTEVGMVGANVTQYSLSLSGNYGDMFCFRVYAFNAAGDSSDSNVACKTLPEAPSLPPVSLPTTPSGLHFTLLSTNTIGIAWSDVEDEAQYLLERRLGDTTEMQIMLAANQTAFTDQDLKRSHTYCYRIAAINRIGSSPFTEDVCAETPPQDDFTFPGPQGQASL